MRPAEQHSLANQKLKEYRVSNINLFVDETHQITELFIRDCLEERKNLNDEILIEKNGLERLLVALEEYKSKIGNKKNS